MKKFRLYISGVLSGAIVFTLANTYINNNNKDLQFSEPHFEESLTNKKTVEELN